MIDWVVKVGGSLLHHPQGIANVQAWLEQQPCDRFFLLFGGGGAVDAMRDLDRTYRLDSVDMHWRCIRLLDATYEVACELFPEATPLPDWFDIETQARLALASPFKPPSRPREYARKQFVVRVGGFYRADDPKDVRRLPQSWDTTSDALAVLLALKLGISQVHLLKACSIDPRQSLEDWVTSGIIDQACIDLLKDESLHGECDLKVHSIFQRPN